MRKSRLCALTFAGLLSLGAAGIEASTANAAGKPECAQDSDSSPALQLAKCIGFADPERLAAALRRQLGLPGDAAARLSGILTAEHSLQGREDQNEPSFAPEIRRVESEFIALLNRTLNRTPDSTGIADELSWFYGRWWVLNPPAPALLDLVARAPDPARLALRLQKNTGSPAGAQILLAALAARPEPAVLWHEAAQSIDEGPWKVAFLEEAYRRLVASSQGRPADPAVATSIAESWIGTQLDLGLAPQAIATLQSLPPAVRSRIEKGTTGKVESKAGGLPFHGELRDLRVSLAAAYLLAGDPKAAAGWIAKIAPDPTTREFSDEKTLELTRQVLSRWLRPSPEDPFDLLTSFLASHVFLPRGTGPRAVARFAERERYPAVAAYCLEFLVALSSSGIPFEPSRGVPPRVRAAAESLRGEIEKLGQSLVEEVRADRDAARIGFGADASVSTVSRLLRAEPGIRFSEQPLPAGLAPVELAPAELEKRQKAIAAELKLPPDFGVVRVERQGERVAAIGVSQAYDPVGEVSSGAYWVLLSSDGGQTWTAPLYTGLRINQPYVARRASKLPLLAEGRLQVEVEIAELDPAKIFFPPVRLRPKRTAQGLYLDIPLDLLQQDSDGDGLTDLAEERLLTDPGSRDTDGDGLEDAVDPLPAVPLSREAPSAQARALAAFVASLWNVDQTAIIEGIPDRPGALCCAKGEVRQGSDRTTFLVADRGLFTALRPGKRLVVLTAGEADAAQKKFGPFYPQRLQAFFFDRSGRRGYAVWSASWQGGQVRLEENGDGTWKAEPTSEWIT